MTTHTTVVSSVLFVVVFAVAYLQQQCNLQQQQIASLKSAVPTDVSHRSLKEWDNGKLKRKVKKLDERVSRVENLIWDSEVDKDAMKLKLVTIFERTNGTEWINNEGWRVLDSDYCTWYGITCDGPKVTKIELSNNNVVGSIELPHSLVFDDLLLVDVTGNPDLSGYFNPDWCTFNDAIESYTHIKYDEGDDMYCSGCCCNSDENCEVLDDDRAGYYIIDDININDEPYYGYDDEGDDADIDDWYKSEAPSEVPEEISDDIDQYFDDDDGSYPGYGYEEPLDDEGFGTYGY
jgi:hypothetical protein